MKLIVALGNPGEKYAKTRHNVGFMAMDFFMENCDSIGDSNSDFRGDSSGDFLGAQNRQPQSFSFSKPREFSLNAKFEAKIIKWQSVIFAKPQTFMNASGVAIKRIADFYRVREIAVLHDDLDLNLGAVRFKFGGGNAGHNGLKSIDNLLGADYLRIRIGIGKPQNRAVKSNESSVASGDSSASSANCNEFQNAVLDFVLGEFSDDEMKILHPTFEIITNALHAFIDGANLQTLQNAYTKKR